MRDTTDLDELGSYSRTLQLLQAEMETGSADQHLVTAAAHLDGLAGREFRRVVSAPTRRRLGTFFTGSELRARAVGPYRRVIAAGGRVLDPACGFGDLLLAAADLIPTTWAPRRRVDHLASHFHGRDLLGPLVSIAAQRFDLWAKLTMHEATQNLIDKRRGPLAHGLTTGDALDGSVNWPAYSLLLLNPPFTSVRLVPNRSWAGGRITQAAPFTLDVLIELAPGTSMAAILPDVLRTGSRYGRWRREIEARAEVKGVDVYGRFDRWTDVDVFVLHLKRHEPATASRKGRPQARMASLPADRVSPAQRTGLHADSVIEPNSLMLDPVHPSTATPSDAGGSWWRTDASTGAKLQDIAVISVGDVVPHRHLDDAFVPPAGSYAKEFQFLTVHNLPIGGELTESPDTVRFHGRTHHGPFVVLRRTSAPSRDTGTPRLRASLYLGADPVAVENHLIVVKPRKQCPMSVRALALALTSKAVTDWLDHRLRLRHLTVTALRQMPVTLLAIKDGHG